MFLMTKLGLDGAITSELHELVADEKIKFFFSERVSVCMGGSVGGVPSSSSSCLQLDLGSKRHSLLTLLESASLRTGLYFILFLKTSIVTHFFFVNFVSHKFL